MALNPVRALLTAQWMSNWNRSWMEFGESGRWVIWLVAALAGLIVVLPAMLLSFGGGSFVAPRLSDPTVVRVVGASLATLVITGGAVGRSRVLDWERARILPLRLRSLYTAELLAGLGDFLPALFALVTAAFLAGIAAQRPRLLLLLVVPWLCTIGSLLCLRHIMGGLVAQFLRRIQRTLLVVALVGMIGILAVARLGLPHADARLLTLLDFLPFTQSIHGLSDALAGRWIPALLRQLYAALLFGLLLLLAARTLARESLAPSGAATESGSKHGRLWSFSTPTRGIARLHWVSLMHSGIGVLGLFTPLFFVFLFSRELATTESGWALPQLLSAVLFVNAAIHFDQFGLDRKGVKSLLLLPVRSTELLAGKTLALATYECVQILTLLFIVNLIRPLSALQALTAVCFAGCQFLLNVRVGHWASVRFPRPLPRGVLRDTAKTNQSWVVAFLGIGMTIVGAAAFGSVYVYTGRAMPALQLPIMLLLLGASIILYWRVGLPHAARRLDENHERLVAALG